MVNVAFGAQQVSGQQRYAAEVLRRLEVREDVQVARPGTRWAGSALRTWLWVLLVLPRVARGATLLSLTSRAPLLARNQVLVVHDLFVITDPQWFSWTYRITHAPLLRAQLRLASRVVAVSPVVAAEIAAIRGQDVAVAPNAPSAVFSDRDDAPSATLESHGVQPGSYFLCVASKDPRKNLVGLAEAYACLTREERERHPLLLVGDHADSFARQSILWPSGVVDLGRIDDHELRRLYRDSGVVVQVSLAEGFGLPLVEAAAAGARRMVVSDIPVFAWICEGRARLVDPTDPVKLAEALREEIGGPGREPVDVSRFDWERTADVIEDVCRSVGRRTTGSVR